MQNILLYHTILISILISLIHADDVTTCGEVKVKSATPLIFNGTKSFAGQWPWLAPLFKVENQYLCGSSIITQWHLLSAAHCVISDKAEDFYTLLGRFNLSDASEANWERRNINEIYVHSDYVKNSVDQMSNGDIAIFKVTNEIKYTEFIQPICLPDSSANVVDINGVVAGYGLSEPIQQQNEDTPSHVVLKSIYKWYCLKKSKRYVDVVSERSFCASNSNSVPCRGDSGGGFYVYDRSTQQYTTYGIVSHAIGICNPKEYVVFVDVPKFIPWIREKVGLPYLCSSGQPICESISKTSKIADSIVNALAYKMRNNDCDEIIEFIKDHTTDREYQERIVKAAYANNKDNAENILKCISSMPYIEDFCATLPALFEEMKLNEHFDTPQLIILAHQIKTVLEFDNYSKVSQSNKDKIETLKNNLPSAVRGIIWNGNSCTMKNKDKNEYLFAASNPFNYDHERRRVFTWRPGGTVIQGYWKFNPLESAKMFEIINNQVNEHLYAASNVFTYDSFRRYVFTWIKGGGVREGEWIIEPDKRATSFKLRNTYHLEHLYAADYKPYDKDRRRVFTYRDSRANVANSDWEINCS